MFSRLLLLLTIGTFYQPLAIHYCYEYITNPQELHPGTRRPPTPAPSLVQEGPPGGRCHQRSLGPGDSWVSATSSPSRFDDPNGSGMGVAFFHVFSHFEFQHWRGRLEMQMKPRNLSKLLFNTAKNLSLKPWNTQEEMRACPPWLVSSWNNWNMRLPIATALMNPS